VGSLTITSIAYLSLSLILKEFWKSVKVWQSYRHKFGGPVFWNTVYIDAENRAVTYFRSLFVFRRKWKNQYGDAWSTFQPFDKILAFTFHESWLRGILNYNKVCSYVCSQWIDPSTPFFRFVVTESKGHILLRYPGCRPGFRPGFRQVHVGLRPPCNFLKLKAGRRQVRAMSTCWDSSNLSATCFRPKKVASWSQTRTNL